MVRKLPKLAKSVRNATSIRLDSEVAREMKKFYYNRTAEEKKLIDDIWSKSREGKSIRKTAEELNVSKDKVEWLMKNLGITKGPKPKAEKSLLEKKMPMPQARKEIKNANYVIIDSPLGRALKGFYYKRTPEDRKLIDKMSDMHLRQNKSIRKIAEELKIPRGKVEYLLSNLGMTRSPGVAASKKSPEEVDLLMKRAAAKNTKVTTSLEKEVLRNLKSGLKKVKTEEEFDKVFSEAEKLIGDKKANSLLNKAISELEDKA